MSTKIGILNELSNILMKKEEKDTVILHFSKQFKIERLLKPFSGYKKQGYSLYSIFLMMIFTRFGGMSLFAMQQTGRLSVDDNTLYRMMNSPLINWRKILFSFALQFMRCTQARCENDKNTVRCYVIDDTTIEKTGTTFEGLSKVYDHCSGHYVWGYKMLTLCFWDGKSLIPCEFSLHRESKQKEYGLNRQQQKKQFSKERNASGCFEERYGELDEEKSKAAIKALHAAVNRMPGHYVLMDSWFVTDYMLHEIRSLNGGSLHAVGMCKMDTRKFEVDGKSYNSQTLIKMNETKKDMVRTSRKFHSKYMVIDAKYKGMPVKLFYIRYKNAKTWTLLLTTDISLSFVKALELYQIRWSIEVMFKECKQYLRLGKAQNTDFCGQIADASLTLITYIILALYKRFQAYETLGALFRHTKAEIIEKTLCERIAAVFLKIVAGLLEILCLDVEESMSRILSAKNTDKSIIILLNAVNQMCNQDDGLDSVM